MSDNSPRASPLRSALKRRKFAVSALINAQRERFQAASKKLLQAQALQSFTADNYDVVITVAPKGVPMLESICHLLADRLPQLQFDRQSMAAGRQAAIYVAANTACLLETATALGMKPHAGKLTSQQRQTIVKHYIDSLRYVSVAKDKEFDLSITIPGVKFVEGEAILSRLTKKGLIDQIFPLHHADDLSELRRSWVKAFLSPQPLDQVRKYFGLKIAMYFAFLGHYTAGLVIPSIVGIIITFITNSQDTTNASDLASVLFSIGTIIWATYYLTSLKSHCSQMASKWSANHDRDTELANFVPRPQFKGECIVDETTGNIRYEYAEIKRKLFRYFVTLPVILASLVAVFVIMIKVLNFQTYWDEVLIKERGYAEWTSFVPKIVFAVQIAASDIIYFKIAVWLNNNENYAFEVVHENQLVSKLVIFQFVNQFLSLFYIAFYEGDMNKLREQLAALLITRQVLGNLTEALYPLVAHLFTNYRKICTINPTNQELSQAELEATLERYDSTFDDHLEMFIQFGYVTLFSQVFPLAALCALLNNLVEIRSDAFKLCVCLQRPFAGQKVKDIGEWHYAYNCMLYVAIIVNCALMVKSGQLARLWPSVLVDPVHVILVGVVVEHLLIAIKLLIEKRGAFSLVEGALDDVEVNQDSNSSSIDDECDKIK